MSKRVSIDDLHFAIDWLESYDGAEDDENNDAAKRVAAWLTAEVNRRWRRSLKNLG